MNKYKICLWLSVVAWLAMVLWLTTTSVAYSQPVEEAEAEVVSIEDIWLETAIAVADVDKPAEEPVTYEAWFREAANKIESCEITHYCAELREHTCGTGDGITATGVPVTPYWTCAVDPSVIPYGSDIMVDYGDRVEFYKAQDCGGAIKGNHIDLMVETHEEALRLGVLTATVYWMKNE